MSQKIKNFSMRVLIAPINFVKLERKMFAKFLVFILKNANNWRFRIVNKPKCLLLIWEMFDHKGWKYIKVVDNCHFTSKYWGITYSYWNLIFAVLPDILIVLDNGSSYNFHR